jgi:hypothetical protein
MWGPQHLTTMGLHGLLQEYFYFLLLQFLLEFDTAESLIWISLFPVKATNAVCELYIPHCWVHRRRVHSVDFRGARWLSRAMGVSRALGTSCQAVRLACLQLQSFVYYSSVSTSTFWTGLAHPISVPQSSQCAAIIWHSPASCLCFPYLATMPGTRVIWVA